WIARVRVPAFAERVVEPLVLGRIRVAEVVPARSPHAVGVVRAEALQHVHRRAHADHERLGLLEHLAELRLLHHGDGLAAPLGGEDAFRARAHHLADVAGEVDGAELGEALSHEFHVRLEPLQVGAEHPPRGVAVLVVRRDGGPSLHRQVLRHQRRGDTVLVHRNADAEALAHVPLEDQVLVVLLRGAVGHDQDPVEGAHELAVPAQRTGEDRLATDLDRLLQLQIRGRAAERPGQAQPRDGERGGLQESAACGSASRCHGETSDSAWEADDPSSDAGKSKSGAPRQQTAPCAPSRRDGTPRSSASLAGLRRQGDGEGRPVPFRRAHADLPAVCKDDLPRDEDPSPSPPACFAPVFAPRRNGPKIRGRRSGGMGGPPLCTSRIAEAFALFTRTSTSAPAPCWIPFATRLETTWAIRSGSQSPITSLGASTVTRACGCAIRSSSTAAAAISARLVPGLRSSGMPPASRARVRSSSWTTIRSMRAALDAMRDSTFACDGGGPSRWRRSVAIEMAPNGLRKSWPRTPTNCSWNCADSRSAASSTLRRAMSRSIANRIAPSTSRPRPAPTSIQMARSRLRRAFKVRSARRR